MGNLRSVEKAFNKFSTNVIITNNHEIIKTADKIVLPGVGSFTQGMRNLHELNLVDILHKEIIHNKKPFLGICLGMQLICNKGYEDGESNGLGWINAEAIKFNHQDMNLKIPHMGWNNLLFKNNNPLLKGIQNHSDFYFVHSFHLETHENIISTTTNYGYEFTSSIQKNNIFACQFHPEKSQISGLRMIENFINL